MGGPRRWEVWTGIVSGAGRGSHEQQWALGTKLGQLLCALCGGGDILAGIDLFYVIFILFRGPVGYPGQVLLVERAEHREEAKTQSPLKPRLGTDTLLFLPHCIGQSKSHGCQGLRVMSHSQWESPEQITWRRQKAQTQEVNWVVNANLPFAPVLLLKSFVGPHITTFDHIPLNLKQLFWIVYFEMSYFWLGF